MFLVFSGKNGGRVLRTEVDVNPPRDSLEAVGADSRTMELVGIPQHKFE